jgi:peptidoglycan/LPS O-acetylase OafA/YrhL
VSQLIQRNNDSKIGIILILSFVRNPSLQQRLRGPGPKFARFDRRSSYSLYLVHVPIGGRVINLAKRFGEGPLYELVIVALALLASVVAAMLLYRFVEAPSMRVSRTIGRHGARKQ